MDPRWFRSRAPLLGRAGRAAIGLCLVLSAWAAPGCGGPDEGIDASTGTDASSDAAPLCTTDEACDDGLACNGEERCDEGRCAAGTPIECDDGIACTSDFCSEELRRCVNRATDADGDGAIAASCVDERGMPLGDDCDDDDPAILPGAMELCDAMGVDEDCDPLTLGGRDGDGDGYVDVACCNGATCGDDCNDAVRGASPTGTEVCNGIDDDCDGSFDEDVQVVVYRDADGDGRGDPSMAQLACALSPGYSVHDDDCDDTDASRSPVLTEACDGIDNDCDGVADPADAPTLTSWFEDEDGDGFGNPVVSVDSCARPMGSYSLLGTDCDDRDRARNPRQAELCNGIDDDCNGVADFALAPGDLEDDDLDGRADARCVPRPVDADCDDRDASSGAGGEEICDGRDNDCDGSFDEGVGVTVFYRDADSDGHGSEASGVTLGCGAVSGFVTSNDDCDDTTDTRNPDVVEGCNGRDDDCDARVDEDPLASICSPLDGAPRACVAGRCRTGSAECPLGRADCDRASGNGCEVSVVDDAANCGACGRRCAAEASASSACSAARCAPLSCVGAFLDCNGDLGRGGDGCERDGATDDANCGGCGIACVPLPHVTRTSCRSGLCGFDPATECESGWSDCNGLVDDGCEAQLGTDAFCSGCGDACAVTEECDATQTCRPRICPGSTADCDANGSCETDLDTTLTSCGACGSPCAGRSATWSCTAGTCRVASCTGTMRNCDSLDSTGCETDSATNIDHCGMCNRACAGGSAVWACVASSCRVTSCFAGFRDCDASAANGCEISTDTDPANCGACGRACPREPGTVAPSCTLATCSPPVCAAGRLDCNRDLGVAGGDGCETMGVCASFVLTPDPVAFPSTAALATSAPINVTVTNPGDSASGPIDARIEGTHATDFVVSTDGCTDVAVPPGGTCVVAVSFAPTSTGPRTANLRIAGFPGGISRAVLSGTGLISTAPLMHNFGSHTVGLASPMQSFVVSNPGTVAAGTMTVSLVGANPGDFGLVSDPCTGASLPAGGTCTVVARFLPTASGARAATLRVVATAGGTATSALAGTGSAPITVAPGTFGFGSITLGAMSTTQTFMVSNPGSIATGTLGTSVVGANPGDFATVTNTCTGVSLAPGGNCSVTLRFVPTAAGARAATVQINGAPGGTATATVTGTGSLPISASPTSQAYGTRTIGQASTPTTFTFSNPGVVTTGTLTVSVIGANPGDFVLGTNTCAGATLAPAANCTVGVSFNPAATGARSATLRVTGAPGGTADVALTGTGSAPITAAPASNNYGTITVGQSSTSQTFNVSNPGSVATGTLAVSLVGANPGDFSLVGGTCNGASVGPAGACTVLVTFVPTASGARAATLRIAGSPGGTFDVALSGTGSAPISVSPTNPGFGTITLGQSSGNVTFTVTNPAAMPTGVPAVSVVGVHPADFPIVTNGCTAPIAGGGNCTIVVRFAPAGTGSRNATLTVSASPGGSTNANLSGTGSAAITLSPTSFAFQPTAVNTDSGQLTITVNNPGSVATGALTPTFSGPGAAAFTIATATCFPIAAGSSCTYFVRVRPTAPGPISATLTVSSTPGGSASTTLTGHGIQLGFGGDSMGGLHGFGGSLSDLACPAGHAIVGFQGRSGLLIDQLEPLCAPISLSTNSSGATYTYPVVVGAPVSAGAAGGAGGGPFGPFFCPANQIATGYAGRIGDDMDAFSVYCESVTFVQTGPLMFALSKSGGGYTAEAGGPGGSGFGGFCDVVGGFWVDNSGVVSGIAARCRPLTVISM
jgi:hypothetical protein